MHRVWKSKIKEVSTLEIMVKRATEIDLDEMVALEQIAFSTPWSRSSFEAELWGNQFSGLFTARRNNESSHHNNFLGYICFWAVFEELRLMNLAVTPLARRQGIGSHLVKFALKYGASQSVTRVLLEVRSSNIAAQNLYKHLGFRQYGTRNSYYTNPQEDGILMHLETLSSVVVEG